MGVARVGTAVGEGDDVVCEGVADGDAAAADGDGAVLVALVVLAV